MYKISKAGGLWLGYIKNKTEGRNFLSNPSLAVIFHFFLNPELYGKEEEIISPYINKLQ